MDVAKGQRRRLLTNTLKIVASAAILFWLLANLDWAELGRVLRDTSPWIFVAGLGLLMAAYMTAAVRWWLLLRRAGVTLPFQSLLPAYLMGVFFNQVLPSSVAGDAVRTYYLSRRGMKTSVLVASALLDRYLGLVAVVFLASGAMLLVPSALPELGASRLCYQPSCWVAWWPPTWPCFISANRGYDSSVRVSRGVRVSSPWSCGAGFTTIIAAGLRL